MIPMGMTIESARLGQAMSISRDGSTAIMDATLQPGAGVPMHRHAAQDERFTVLDGEALMWIGWRRLRLTAGESASVARGKAHSLRNRATVPLRVRAELSPGLRTEDFFDDMFALADAGHVTRRGLADAFAIRELARDHGQDVPMLPIVPIALQRRILTALQRRGAE